MAILTFVEYKKCVSNKMASVDINKFIKPDGFKCPSPEELILLSDGSQKRAGDLIVGDTVKTRHEKTNEINNFAVSYVEIIPNTKRCKLNFELNSLVCSYSHKLLVGTEWKTAEDLIFGDVVSGQAFLGTEPVEDGDVVLITVEDAHTYIVNGLLSHNKSLPMNPEVQPGKYKDGGRGNPPVAPTKSGSSSGSGRKPVTSGTPVDPNNLQVSINSAGTGSGASGTPGNPNNAQIGSGYSVPTGAVASAPLNAGTQTGSFDFKKIMDSFYNYKPKEDGDATDMQKQAYQGNMVQSILDSQLAQQLGQYNAGLAQDNMTHQADLEQRNQAGLMADEFAYGMAGMDAQFKYGEQGQQNQHERDIGMLSATGEEQRLNLAAQGDQDRLGQIVTGEQNRLTNDLNNKSSEAIASGRYSADTTIASTQADASKYGSSQAAEASKYGSQASKDASIYGSDRSAQSSMYGSDKSAEASIYGSTASKDASIYGSQASKDASIYGSDASKTSSMYGSDKSAQASMYGADKSLEGSKYSTDGTIRNTRATGDETRKTMNTEQQLKAKERAGMHKYARGTARAM